MTRVPRFSELSSRQGAQRLQTVAPMANASTNFDVALRVDQIRDDEWCVSMNGEHVIAFAGPDAEVRAQQCARELQVRLDIAGQLDSTVIH